MRRTAAALVFGLAIAAAGPGLAQAPAGEANELQALRQLSESDKKALVESTLKLTAGEAKKFWPAYTTYQRTLEMTNRRRTVALEGLAARDKPMSDPYARNLAAELMAADEAEMKARHTLYRRVARALPPKKAARYMQLESKLRAVQAYDIAIAFPLIR